MRYHLACLACGFEFDEVSFVNECPKCQGLIEAVIDRVRDAKPDRAYGTILKYHEFLPLADVARVERFESSIPTPLISAPVIAKKLGLRALLLKDETVMQSGTMKDREALLTINRLLINNIKGLVLGSSGNAGLAICAYASRVKGPKVYLYLPESSRRRMASALAALTDPEFVEVIYVGGGSTDEAENAGRVFAAEAGIPYGTGFQNYSRREGVKTLALEYLFEQPVRADWYVQGVAGALAVYAFHKVHKELSLECPRLACIQPDACAPLVDAYHARAQTLEDRFVPAQPVTVPEAPVLKSRRPTAVYPILKTILDEVSGVCEKVSSDEIRKGLDLFYEEPYFLRKLDHAGIRVGMEAATAMAGLERMRASGELRASDVVLLNVSGAARPGDIPDSWWPPRSINGQGKLGIP